MQASTPTAVDAGQTLLGKALRTQAARASRHVLAEVPDLRQLVDYRLATEILGRWLQTGQGASQQELDQIVRPGISRRCFSIEAFCSGFSVWRETVFSILREEASRSDIDPAQLAEINALTSRGLDASLVRSSRLFDKEHERLEAEIQTERARLAHEALHDSLTGLPNRMLLNERIQHALAAAQRHDEYLALLFIDLDGFKSVNDRLGHTAGDEVLRQAADRLRDIVRPYDTVARLGGDELIVFCERLASPGEATAVVERTLTALSAPYQLENRQPVDVGASIGVAFRAKTQGAADLIASADAAMYLAKRRGGAQYAHAQELPALA